MRLELRLARLSTACLMLMGAVLSVSPKASAAVFDDPFTGTSLKPEWTTSIPLEGPVFAVQDGLKITVPAIAFDSWSTVANAPDIHIPIKNEDFKVSARLTDFVDPAGDPAVGNIHAALIVAFGPMDILYWGSYSAPETIRLERSGVGSLGQVTIGALPVDLQITRTGNVYTFQYKEASDADWLDLTDANGDPVKVTDAKVPAYVGIMQKTWAAVPLTATWKNFHFDGGVVDFGTINGKVTTTASNPGEVGIRFINSSGAVAKTILLPPDGTYSEQVPAGAYTVQLFGSGLSGPAADRKKSATVAVGQTQTVDFTGVAMVADLVPGSGQMFTDDFAGTTLKSDWQTVIPVAGPTVAVNGDLKITLPDTRAFDFWIGNNSAPRVVVPAPKGDFNVSARILPANDSAGSAVEGANYQTKLLITFGDTDFLVYGLSTSNDVLSIQRAGGGEEHFAVSAPVSVRIEKDGFKYSFFYRSGATGNWNQLTDANGTAITRIINETPQAVGLIAKSWGNVNVIGNFDDFALEGVSLPKYGTIAGTVTTNVPSPQKLKARILNDNGEIFTVVSVAASGAFSAMVPEGSYTVQFVSDSIVNPSSAVKSVTVAPAATANADLSVDLIPDPSDTGNIVFEDKFDGTTLKPEWKLTNPDDLATFAVGNGNLAITLPEGVFDHWVNLQNAPRITVPLPEGDWMVTGKFVSLNDEAGEPIADASIGPTIQVYFADDEIPALMFGAYRRDTWIRLEYNGQNGLTDAFIENPPVWYQIRRKGSEYRFYYKLTDDGVWFPMTNAAGNTYVYTKTETPVRAGIEDKTWSAPAHTSTWTEFRIQTVAETPPVMPGDLNGDGKINVQDATLSLRIAVGLLTPSAAQTEAGDVNNDGKLNIQDTTLILQVAVGNKPASDLK